MIISEEQARAVADFLKSRQSCVGCGDGRPVPDDVVMQAVAEATRAPELREERVAEARSRLAQGSLDAHDVAEKMISRILSDSLR